MVLDSDTKNQRDICMAKDAGYVSYPGLPGQVKMGYMAFPAFKSCFCQQHTERSSTTTDTE